LFGSGEHTAFWVHAMQLPPLHTWFAPHDVPSATFFAFEQTEAPVEQLVDPTWQRLLFGLQTEPAVHPTQVPVLSQTWLVPQAVPVGAPPSLSTQLMPPSTHWALPV
jgi:hypothetical protein